MAQTVCDSHGVSMLYASLRGQAERGGGRAHGLPRRTAGHRLHALKHHGGIRIKALRRGM